MATDDVLETIRAALVSLTPKQFDQFAEFLVRTLDETATVEFVSADSDVAVDLVVTVEQPFVTLQYGIALRQVSPDTALDDGVVEAVVTGCADRGLQTAGVITTGSFTAAARAAAEEHGLSLVDGTGLAELLLEEELGVIRTTAGVELDEEFWELFRGQTRTSTIPSLEIPQADSLARLDQTLRAVADGNHHKEAIAAAVERLSGDSFDPRQADYYGTAGWLLGFLHKDLEGKGDRGRGRWGVTRHGRTYLARRDSGDESGARELLYEKIQEIEIIRRILSTLRTEGTMRRSEIVDLVERETELGGTTVPRRTRTLISWLEHLPAITVSGQGSSQTVTFQPSTAGDDSTRPNVTSSETSQLEEAPEHQSMTEPDATPPDEDSILDSIMDSFDDELNGKS